MLQKQLFNLSFYIPEQTFRSTIGRGVKISRQAGANWPVAFRPALGVGSAGSWTGVHTLFIDTGPVAGTLGIDDTLWPAVGRGADVVGQTRAGSNLVGVLAL